MYVTTTDLRGASHQGQELWHRCALRQPHGHPQLVQGVPRYLARRCRVAVLYGDLLLSLSCTAQVRGLVLTRVALFLLVDLDMAGRHRARYRSIQIIAVKEVAAAKCKRPNITQFHVRSLFHHTTTTSRRRSLSGDVAGSRRLTPLFCTCSTTTEHAHQVPVASLCAANLREAVQDYLPCRATEHHSLNCSSSITRIIITLDAYSIYLCCRSSIFAASLGPEWW